MAREDGFLKDLFFAVGVATVALGTAYLVAKTVKKKLNIENESIFGEDCICVHRDDDDIDDIDDDTTEDEVVTEGADEDTDEE